MKIPFITEQNIDAVAEKFSTQPSAYEEAIADMQAQQPILFSYLLSESFELLTKAESDYLLYLSLVIWKAIYAQNNNHVVLDSLKIEEIEEQNWVIFNETNAKKFPKKLDAFFKNYPQEDLLAFVEDALIDDEDSFVTKEGKELLFIGLKTEIDSLCHIAV